MQVISFYIHFFSIRLKYIELKYSHGKIYQCWKIYFRVAFGSLFLRKQIHT